MRTNYSLRYRSKAFFKRSRFSIQLNTQLLRKRLHFYFRKQHKPLKNVLNFESLGIAFEV